MSEATIAVDAEKVVPVEPVEGPPPSPEMLVLREELAILQNIFHVLGEARIPARECKLAMSVLDYVQARITGLELKVAELVEKEKN